MKKTTLCLLGAIAASAFAGPDTIKDASLVDDLRGDGGKGFVGHHAKADMQGTDSNPKVGTVPEPATMAVLGLGAAALLRKRATKR